MRYFPLFLDVHQTRCLIVGGGAVGCRKLTNLLEAGCQDITVVEPGEPSVRLAALSAGNTGVHIIRRPFSAADIAGMNLVFATTNNVALNNEIRDACNHGGIPCDSASEPEHNGFIIPAVVEVGPLAVAISTQGGSPALARKLKQELRPVLDTYAPLAVFMQKIRPLVLKHLPDVNARTGLFRSIVDSPLHGVLASRDRSGAEEILCAILPPSLHHYIKELLDGLV